MTNQLPPRFITYRREWQADKSKWDKVPIPGPHMTYDDARRAVAGRDGLGVGWVLNGDGWFFLDLDNCTDEAGAWTSEAQALFLSFSGALGEVSVGGKGLHIIGRCDPSKLADRRNKWNGDREFYINDRFVALSDNGLAPIGGTWVDRDWTDQLLCVVPERPYLGDLLDGRDPSYTGPDDDEELLAMALRSGNVASQFGAGVSFRDLWEGNVTALAQKWPHTGGFDRSSADAALMSHLAFWTGKDMPRMDRLFRRSALMRDKYEKRADYRRDTIHGAARLCNRVYDRSRMVTGAAATDNRGEVFLSVPEMQQHFEGCVYIRDMHRVLVPDGAILKPEQFNATYGGHMFQMMPDGSKPSRKAFEAFTESSACRFPQAKFPIFRPDLPTSTIVDGGVNIYRKPDVAVRAGNVSRFERYLSLLLPDARDRQILICYLAALVQNPGVKFQWAPVLQGVEGNGKTLVASCAAYALGRKYTHQPIAKHLGGQFNSYLEGKLFIIVEEIHMEGRRAMLDDLKPLITNLEIEIEGKGVDQRMIRNTTNWFFCTNYEDAVLKNRNDRRYAIFFTAQQSVDDLVRDGMGGEFFPRMYHWLRSEGGYAAVAHWLLNYPVPDELNPAGLCHRAPITSSTEAAIGKSMGPVEAEITEAVEGGVAGFRGGWVSSNALAKMLRDRGVRISRIKLASIMFDLGYYEWGRAPRAVMCEDATRPKLWFKGDPTGVDFEGFLSAQAYYG